MNSVEVITGRPITPEDLQHGFNQLLDTRGHDINYADPRYTMGRGICFLAEKTQGPPFDKPYYGLQRGIDLEEGTFYRWEQTVPRPRQDVTSPVGTGYEETRIIFRDDQASFKRHFYGVVDAEDWADRWQEIDSEGELSEAKIHDIYSLISSPDLAPRLQVIKKYHQDRYEQRSTIGQFMSRVFGLDSLRLINSTHSAELAEA